MSLMIVCHCTRISDTDIRAAIDWMRASDPDTIITPGKIYRALGKAPDCGGCLPVFMGVMEASDSFCVPGDPPLLRSTGRRRAEGEG